MKIKMMFEIAKENMVEVPMKPAKQKSSNTMILQLYG